MRPDGSATRQITAFGSDARVFLSSGFRWSPDGRRILFIAALDGQPGGSIFVADLADGSVNNLTPDSDMNHWPVWSPDGRRIAFMRFQAGPSQRVRDLFVMNADGTNVVRLTQNHGFRQGIQTDWSPDGRHLAYSVVVRDSNGVILKSEIEIRDISTGSVQSLTGLGEQPRNPVWSPDGRKLAVSYVTGLEIVDAGGGWKVKRIWSGEHPEPHLVCGSIRPFPVWRPRG